MPRLRAEKQLKAVGSGVLQQSKIKQKAASLGKPVAVLPSRPGTSMERTKLDSRCSTMSRNISERVTASEQGPNLKSVAANPFAQKQPAHQILSTYQARPAAKSTSPTRSHNKLIQYKKKTDQQLKHRKEAFKSVYTKHDAQDASHTPKPTQL